MAASTPRAFPILDLSPELLKMTLREVALDSKHDLIAVSMCCKDLRRHAREIIFERIQLLTRGATRTQDTEEYARLAQGRPLLNDPKVSRVFTMWPADFLRFTHSLAIHDFYQISDTSAIRPMADGLARMLLKPMSLRTLEIDFDERIADRLEQLFEGVPDVEFPDLLELTMSMELRFLLNYTPRLVSLSNRPQEGYSSSIRDYDDWEVEELWLLCQNLLSLTSLDLHIHGFQDTFQVRLPTLPIHKLHISRERRRGPNDPYTWNDQDVVPMGLIMARVRAQPNLRHLEIPDTDRVLIGSLTEEHPELEPEESGASLRVLLGAVIAQEFPDLETITVGSDGLINVGKCTETGRTILTPEMPGYVTETSDVRIFKSDAEGRAVWVDFEDVDDPENEDGWISFIAVDPTCWAINYTGP